MEESVKICDCCRTYHNDVYVHELEPPGQADFAKEIRPANMAGFFDVVPRPRLVTLTTVRGDDKVPVRHLCAACAKELLAFVEQNPEVHALGYSKR